MSSHKKSKKNLCKNKRRSTPGVEERLATLEQEFQALKAEVRTRLGDVTDPAVAENEAAGSEGHDAPPVEEL